MKRFLSILAAAAVLLLPVHASVDDALSYALEAAQPYVKEGFTVREDYWGGDMAVKQAKAYLESSKDPSSLFWLGQIQESTGDLAGARKTYEAGAEQFKGDPAQQRLFQASLDRLNAVMEEVPAPREKPGEDKPGKQSNRRQLPAEELGSAPATLLLMALQEGTPPDKQDKKAKE